MIQLAGSSPITVADLTNAQFERVGQILHQHCGIRLKQGTHILVKSRLMKRLRVLGMENFGQYLGHLASSAGQEELIAMIDSLTTNKTSFFREPQHFDFMRRQILPEIASRQQAPRIWSAGCSTGEEPYSLAIMLLEHLPPALIGKAGILATDISTRVLATASEALYLRESLHGMTPHLAQKYFKAEEDAYRVEAQVRRLVRIARLNLMDTWPMRGPFDAIFCRNVMIYFDKPTQETLVRRFAGILRPGGYLCVGHSESIFSSGQDLRYVQPAVYVKVEDKP